MDDNTSGVKRYFEYLPAIIKFHKLQNEGLARLIFVLVLLCQMAGSYIQYRILNQVSSENWSLLISALTIAVTPEEANAVGQLIYPMLMVLVVALVVKLVTSLLLSVYMFSYIAELRGKDTSMAASFRGVFKRIGRLVVYNLLFGLIVVMGLMFFIIPGIIAYIIFVFGFCYILDLKLNVADAFTASSDITKKHKIQLASVFIGFYLMFELPIALLISGSSLGSAYLAAFFSTFSSLVLQRLISQIYMDLEYRKERMAK